jgi:hypothetical protein
MNKYYYRAEKISVDSPLVMVINKPLEDCYALKSSARSRISSAFLNQKPAVTAGFCIKN